MCLQFCAMDLFTDSSSDNATTGQPGSHHDRPSSLAALTLDGWAAVRANVCPTKDHEALEDVLQ